MPDAVTGFLSQHGEAGLQTYRHVAVSEKPEFVYKEL